MASTYTDSMDRLQQSIEVNESPQTSDPDLNPNCDMLSVHTMESVEDYQQEHQDGDFSRNNCNDSNKETNGTIKISSTSKAAGQTVAPYLAKHIPGQYAPLGQQSNTTSPTDLQKDPNTKYCYRHRPDSKCRGTADEPTMESLQRALEVFPESDQQAISHAWALFSAAPAKQRQVILQGLLTQCCFPQLSYLSSTVKELIKIDFVSALPAEISYKILCYLDTKSLTKAARVSLKWRQMADDDEVWHNMCVQHVNKKCKKCGWGLPLLEKQRLREWKRQQQLIATGRGLNEWSPRLTPVPDEGNGTNMVRAISLNGSGKRSAESLESSTSLAISKRHCVKAPTKTVPWKNVYKDRYKVSTNWKYGRHSTKVFRGHSNGVTCLQFDDKILATGSYDSTIKIWNIETGDCLKTLRGHTLGVRALQFDGRVLISGSLDNTIKVWDLHAYKVVKTLRGHTKEVVSVAFEGSTLVSGSADCTIRVWNFQGNDSTCHVLTGHEDWVNSVRLHAASRTVFSASDDMTIRLWDLDTNRCLRIFEGHVAQVQQVTLLPPEYEEPDENERDQDETDQDDDSSLNLDADSPISQGFDIFANWPEERPRPPNFIISASLDSAIRLWRVDNGSCLKKIFGHVQGVWAVAGDNLRFVSGAEDKTVRVWDARTGKMEKSFAMHEAPVACIGLSDCRIASGSEDNTAQVLSFRSEEVDAMSPPAADTSLN